MPRQAAWGGRGHREKSFALATNASRRRSDRACPSLEEAEVFAEMKQRPFPARIWETVRNIDRAPPGHHITKSLKFLLPQEQQWVAMALG